MDALRVQRGANLRFNLQWQNGDTDAPLDFMGATITIRESNRQAILTGGVVEWIDEDTASASVFLSEGVVAELTSGPTNWLTLEVQRPGENDVAGPIFIDVTNEFSAQVEQDE